MYLIAFYIAGAGVSGNLFVPEGWTVDEIDGVVFTPDYEEPTGRLRIRRGLSTEGDGRPSSTLQ